MKWMINCYESKLDGSLVIYIENEKGRCEEIAIPAHDVDRMMIAGIDALKRKPSRR